MLKYFLLAGVSALIFTGCVGNEPKPKSKPKIKISCNVGKLSPDKKHCLISSKPLIGVVKNVKLNKEGYIITISDERGRVFDLKTNKSYKIGDMVNINLYKKPNQIIIKD